MRASLVPGAVLILLAGKFRGKRVVLLSVLPSGLLLVTGPYKLNGVPLRRVNASFVIATSTRVDLTGLKLKPEITTDAYYTAPKTAKPKRTGKDDAVFAAAKGKKVREKQKKKKPKIPEFFFFARLLLLPSALLLRRRLTPSCSRPSRRRTCWPPTCASRFPCQRDNCLI